MLRLRVLGALDATIQASGGAEVLDLGGPRQRGVLALLLVARGQVVSVDRLVEDLWNGEPPRRAIGALQAYVSHLRRSLEPDRLPRTPASVLVSEPPGYAIRLPPDAVDAWRFEDLVRRAGDPTRADHGLPLLQEALALWRGHAYGEFAAESWAAPEAARLDGLRITTRERWCEATLRSGDAQEAVLVAESLTREYPLREEGWRLLAMGLYAGGRQADALTALRRARDILAEELGIDPGPALLKVETDVLAQRLVVRTTRSSRHVTMPEPPVSSSHPPPTEIGPADDAAPEAVGRPSGQPHGTVEEASDFVGREPELNSLHALAAQALTRPGPRVALIAGEPGAGKSRLVQRFARELGAGSWRVVVGRCPESAGAPPAWGWVEIVRALTADVDPGQLAGALAPLTGDAPTNAGEWDASFGRFLLSRALTDYLTDVAGNRPLMVILDDLHRADAETLALLESVAAGSAGVPLLLIGTYRPVEVLPNLRDTLAALATLPPTRISLDGLDSTHAARLIRSVAGVQPDTATLDALQERTGGNPFYLTESARLLGSEGRLVATSKVPEGVRDVLRRRLARLPELTVSVLRLAAVIGRDIDIDVLIGAAEVDEDVVLDALEAGVLAGLLTEPTAGSVRFAHVLVRDTLYDDAPLLRRSRWHARVAAAVATANPDDAAALAHHYHQAGSTATARPAVDAAARAAEQAAARYAHDTAATLFGQALADLARVPAPANGSGHDPLAEEVDLLARQSGSYLAAGAGVAAKHTRERALRLADRAGRIELLIRALSAWDVPTPWLNRTYGVIDGTVVPLIEQVLRSPDPRVTPGVRSRMLCALVAEVAGEEPDRALTAAQEALTIARDIGDPVLVGLALHATCSVVTPELDPGLRLQIGAELLELGQRPGLAVFALIGHHSMTQVYGATGDHRRMIGHVEALEALVATYRWRQAEGIAGMHRGLILHLTGQLAQAEATYAAAADTIRSSGALDAGGIIMLAVLTIRLTQGRAGELAVLSREVESQATDVMAELLALVCLHQGQPAEQVRRIRGAVRPVRRDFFRCLFLALRGMLVAGLADEREAAELYPELLLFTGQIAGGGTGSYAAGPVDTVLGDLCVLVGRSGDAATHYRAAVDLARSCGNEQWAQHAAERLSAMRGQQHMD
jgi:DNA-binding SARP family transcriptional activator/tetratricopeptide (TPR) repeat protein